MSVFLMGCYDERKQQWLTVAKCGNGHDDDTIKKLQTQLHMVKINKVTILFYFFSKFGVRAPLGHQC